jgi:hypothetical protein
MVACGADWQLPEATLRYRVEIIGKPTHPSAGYFARLPDGGILRGVTPGTVVITDDGKTIPSYLLWHNPESGFSLVFGDPGGAKQVSVYISPVRQAQFWRPSSGLTPSAILCVAPGQESMLAAQTLGKLGAVGPAVHAINKAGIPRAPLSIGGDESGRPKPAVFYHLAYVNAPVAGKYWFAPFSVAGATDVLVNGTKLVLKEQSTQWGGFGASVDLERGLQRVEVFQTAPGTGPYATGGDKAGLSYLTWRLPNEQLKQVEARVLKESEIARSGEGKVLGIEAKTGLPVACAQTRAGLTYWFENEEPLILYSFQALPGKNPPDTVYTWIFPDGGTATGAEAQWLLPGFRESKVRLVAKSGANVSQTTISVFGFSTVPTSLDRADHRDAFRDTLAKMLSGYPPLPDPVATWTDAHWNNLLRTVEQGEGYAVLRQLFTERWATLQKKLGTGQVSALQDVLVEIAQRDNPREAGQWLEKFLLATKDENRRNQLRLRNAEVLMFSLGNREQAATYLNGLANVPGETGERAKIRLGDLALLSGDLNKATTYYAEMQNLARTRRNASVAVPGGLVTNQLLAGGVPNAPATAATPPAAGKANAPANPAEGSPLLGRGGALQDVSLSENVQTLTEGGFLLEARQALLLWEREFPLSKISSDYIIRESAYYMKGGDWKRARPMLEAYCREIDASSFLPQAASMLITCIKQSKEPRESIREVIEKVKARLLFHPVAQELDAFLAGK